MIHAYLYIQKDHQDFEAIASLLATFQESFPHELMVVDLDSEPYLKLAYQEKAPVLDIGPYRLTAPIQKHDLRFAFIETQKKLEAAQEKGDQLIIERFSQAPKLSGSDKFSYWFSSHYMLLFNLLVLIYVGLPFLAPVLMKLNLNRPAYVIYKIYKPLCHQLAFRSWFLFGEQHVYPRELAGVEDLATYGEVTGNNEFDLTAARDFTGNQTMGYKVALCERDVAIYGAILLFGLVFSLSGKRIKPIPWYLWLILGIVPIGLDGFSQLVTQIGFSFLAWFPVRESTPLLRTITGALFGFFTAWYGYPYMEESVAESRDQMENKMALIRQMQRDQRVKLT